MAVKTLTPKLDHTSLREALDRIANRPDHLAWALAAVGFLYGDLAKQPPGDSPTEDTTGTPLNIRFGNLPYTTISDTSSHEPRRATEETEITPHQVVKIVETHIEASDAEKLKDKNKMWKERRHEDNEIFEEIKELSAALGLEKPPCSRHRISHRELVKVRTDLKEDIMQQKNAARAAAEKTAALKTAQQKKTAAPETAQQKKTAKQDVLRQARGRPAAHQKTAQQKKKTAAQKAADNAAQAAAEKKTAVQRAAENTAAENTAKDAAATSTAAEDALAQETAAVEAAAVTTTCEKAGGIDTDGTGNENQEKNSHITQLSTAVQPKMPCSEIHVDCPPKKTQDVEKTAAEEAAVRAAESAAEAAAKEAALQRAAETAAAEKAAAEAPATSKTALRATLERDIRGHGLSPDLTKLVLSSEDRNRGSHHFDEKKWLAKAQSDLCAMTDTERILSAETYACLFHQLAYYFTPVHLEGNEHASKLYHKDNGFTFKEIMKWRRMQGITLDELRDIVEADPDLYYRSNVEAHYTNIDWDEMSDMYDHDHLDGMSDDDKKKYLLKNADQENLNNVYGFDERPDIEFLDFVVFSRKLVNS